MQNVISKGVRTAKVAPYVFREREQLREKVSETHNISDSGE
jgi:hypothetical protein